MKSRSSFVFYKSFLGIFFLVKKSQRWDLLEALCAYALRGEETELSAPLEAAMSAMKPLIDANFQRYENRSKHAGYGAERGRNKGS